MMPSGPVGMVAMNRVLHAVSCGNERGVRSIGWRTHAERETQYQQRGNSFHTLLPATFSCPKYSIPSFSGINLLFEGRLYFLTCTARIIARGGNYATNYS